MYPQRARQLLSSPDSLAGSRPNLDHGVPFALASRDMVPPYVACVHNLPQPIEIDPVSYPRNSSHFPPWDSCLIGPLGDVNPPFPHLAQTSKAEDAGVGGRSGSQDPLTAWYTGSDEPWTGLAKGAVSDIGPDHRVHTRGRQMGSRTTPYRSSPGTLQRLGTGTLPDIITSSFAVPHSDSGYESRRSLECASVRSNEVADHSLDVRSLASRTLELQPYLGGSFKGQTHPEIWDTTQSVLPIPGVLFCPDCQKHVKTKSELKKHDLRHRKPFTCGFRDCTRKEGFSTTNDRDRHVMSKHPEKFSEQHLLKTYNCPVERCKSRDKSWRRLDNFRSHLKRMHHFSEDTVEDYVIRACKEQKSKPILVSEAKFKGVTLDSDQEHPSGKEGDILDSSFQESHTGGPAPDPPRVVEDLIDPSLENKCLLPVCQRDGGTNHKEAAEEPQFREASCNPNRKQEDPSKQPEPNSPQPGGQDIKVPCADAPVSPAATLQSADARDTGKKSEPRGSLATEPTFLEAITALLAKAGFYQPSKDRHEIPGESRDTCLPGKDEHGILAAIGPSEKQDDTDTRPTRVTSNARLGCHNEDQIVQDLLKTLKVFGFTVKGPPKLPASKQTPRSHEAAGIRKHEVQCPECYKFRGRRCELKKHMKRHERPYGCTFANCKKKFGSKNDWKRHENSQHIQVETWQCDEKTSEGTCTKVCYHPETFRTHLTHTHKMDDGALVEQKMKRQHLSPNQQNQFWCGFCTRRINLSCKGVAAWNERFDHIDGHFMGRIGEKRIIEEWIFQGRQAQEAPSGKAASRTPSPSPSPSSSSSSSSSSTGGDLASADGGKRRCDEDVAERPAKRARASDAEWQVVCCQCNSQYPKAYTECDCTHVFCASCEEHVVVWND